MPGAALRSGVSPLRAGGARRTSVTIGPDLEHQDRGRAAPSWPRRRGSRGSRRSASPCRRAAARAPSRPRGSPRRPTRRRPSNARRSVGASSGRRAEQPRAGPHRPEPDAQRQQVDRREEPAHHHAQSLSRLTSQRPTASCISRWRCHASSTGASVGQLGSEPRMAEEHDQIGAGHRVRQRVARGGTEAGAALPGPRLGERQHHPRAAVVAPDPVRRRAPAGPSRSGRADRGRRDRRPPRPGRAGRGASGGCRAACPASAARRPGRRPTRTARG